jgi:O-antigen/teichoic acid export membrane protein
MFLRVIAVVLSFGLVSLFLRRFVPREVRGAQREYATGAWISSAASFLFLGGLFFIQNQIDIVMLGFFEPSASVGRYRVVVVAASFSIFVLHAVNAAAGPIIARLARSGEFGRLQSIVTLSTRVMFFGSLPISLLFIFFGEPIIRFVYGGEFSSASTALAIRCFGQIINTACGSVVILLNMSGHERDTLRAYVFVSALNVILNLFLIPRFGIDGAALSTSVTVSIVNILLALIVTRRLGIHSTILGNTSRFFGQKGD